MNLNELAKEIHIMAVEHGWWEDERGLPEILMLCNSELCEALEEYRNGRAPTETYFADENGEEFFEHEVPDELIGKLKPEGIPTELADCIIRILDYCGKENIDMQKAILDKIDFNATRPYRHGGKKA